MSRHLQDRFGQGLALYLSTVFLFGLLDSTAKLLAKDMSPLQVVWGRYAFHLLFMLPMMAMRPPSGWFKVNRPDLAALRGVLLVVTTMMFFTALAFIPIADATAIGFVGPLFVVALSVPLLGEKVGPRRWAAVIVGFIGSLVILRPGLGVVHPAALLCVGMAFVYALFQILTRRLTATEDPTILLFYSAVVGTLMASLPLPFVWVTPDARMWALMAATGLFGGLGHLVLLQAFRRAEASVLAPFGYLQILNVTLLGYLLFGDLPDPPTVIGSAIIISAGLYVAYRERRIAANVRTT